MSSILSFAISTSIVFNYLCFVFIQCLLFCLWYALSFKLLLQHCRFPHHGINTGLSYLILFYDIQHIFSTYQRHRGCNRFIIKNKRRQTLAHNFWGASSTRMLL